MFDVFTVHFLHHVLQVAVLSHDKQIGKMPLAQSTLKLHEFFKKSIEVLGVPGISSYSISSHRCESLDPFPAGALFGSDPQRATAATAATAGPGFILVSW